MKAIVCVDDRNGMMFNKRRVSRDREVCRAILEMCAGKRLLMNESSSTLFMPLFKEYRNKNLDTPEIVTDSQYMTKAGDEDWCFVEDVSLKPYQNQIDTLVIYRWNRCYPADFHLDITTDRWQTVHCREFCGFSHEKITEEIYENA